jgi:hypothetical protein
VQPCREHCCADAERSNAVGSAGLRGDEAPGGREGVRAEVSENLHDFGDARGCENLLPTAERPRSVKTGRRGGGEQGVLVRLIKPCERSRSNFPTDFLPL